MKTIAKCAAVASIALLSAGGAAWAQGYGANQGFTPNQGMNPNQQTNQGFQQPYQGAQEQGFRAQEQGFRGNLGFSPMAAQNELSRFGYTDIHNLQPMQGWSADAMENGQLVHVIIGQNGRIATFRGVASAHRGGNGREGNVSQQNFSLPNRNAAEQELAKYGFNNVRNLNELPGWSAIASKNGETVRVLLGADGRIATFRGVPEGTSGSSGQFSENSWAGSGNPVLADQARFAQQKLEQFGYSDIRNLRPTEGWSADATKNGNDVHVLLGQRGMVATFRGID
jgi:hypothetical protein